MRAIELMKDEHRAIEEVLESFKVALDQLEKRPEAARAGEFLKFCDFFSLYADRFHHAKEEDTYFQELRKAGVTPEGGPLGVMYEEHEENRRFIRKVRGAAEALRNGDTSRIDELVRAGVGYFYTLRDHIEKEDEAVYEMAYTYLTDDQMTLLDQTVEEVRNRFESDGSLKRCETLFQELTGEGGRRLPN